MKKLCFNTSNNKSNTAAPNEIAVIPINLDCGQTKEITKTLLQVMDIIKEKSKSKTLESFRNSMAEVCKNRNPDINYSKLLIDIQFSEMIIDECFGKNRIFTVSTNQTLSIYNSLPKLARSFIEAHYLLDIPMTSLPMLFGIEYKELVIYEQNIFKVLQEQLEFVFRESTLEKYEVSDDLTLIDLIMAYPAVALEYINN